MIKNMDKTAFVIVTIILATMATITHSIIGIMTYLLLTMLSIAGYAILTIRGVPYEAIDD